MVRHLPNTKRKPPPWTFTAQGSTIHHDKDNIHGGMKYTLDGDALDEGLGDPLPEGECVGGKVKVKEVGPQQGMQRWTVQ